MTNIFSAFLMTDHANIYLLKYQLINHVSSIFLKFFLDINKWTIYKRPYQFEFIVHPFK